MADERSQEEDFSPPQDAAQKPDEAPRGSEDDFSKPASEIPAPSIGPHTEIDYTPPEERLDHDKISDTDAMGLDKRRQVVGHSYSASIGKQVAMYGIFLAVVAALVVGGKLLADELDAPPAEYADEAPWSSPEAKQISPTPLQ